ncbi:MAG: ParA family protein [Phycisphaerales bacterium]
MARMDARVRAIAMMNQKGGVGKTTTTVNLGAALAELGERVLLVDLDPQSHLSLHLGCELDPDQPTAYDLLLDPECATADVVVNISPNLDLIPAEVDLAAAEGELAHAATRHEILPGRLAEVADSYDIIMFDCPPSLGLLTISALTAAREVMIPMQAHFLPLQGVGRLLETVRLVHESLNPQLRVTGIILCAYESNTTLAGEIVSDLQQFFTDARGHDVPWRDCRVLAPAIRRNIKLAEAPSFGRTIFDYAPWCAGASDYHQLAVNLRAAWHGQGPLTTDISDHQDSRAASKRTSPTPSASASSSSSRTQNSRTDASQQFSEAPADTEDASVTDDGLASLIEDIESLDRAFRS